MGCLCDSFPDDGRTWDDPTRVPTETDSDEISYAYLPSGRVLGITRSSAAKIKRDRLEEIVPGGKEAPLNSEAATQPTSFIQMTWAQPGLTPNPPGWVFSRQRGPIRFHYNGRVLLLYGNRVFPYGTQVVGSRDGGQTWDLDHPILLSCTVGQDIVVTLVLCNFVTVRS